MLITSIDNTRKCEVMIHEIDHFLQRQIALEKCLPDWADIK